MASEFPSSSIGAADPMTKRLTIVVSSAGRRVQLVRLFQRGLPASGHITRVIAVDRNPLAPAMHTADEGITVSHCLEGRYIDELTELCRSNAVDLLVPTIDTELAAYAESAASFAAHGTTVLVSAPETVEICASKLSTHRWLSERGFPSPQTSAVAESLSWARPDVHPLIVKPDRGSASIDVRVVTSEVELRLLADVPSLIAQEQVTGIEYTVDAYVSREGRVLGAVPRRRLEVRGGEMSKGVTERDPMIEHLARAVASELPGASGPLTIQLIVDGDGQPYVIDINPRFGGGFPLSAHAGADFTLWALEEVVFGSVQSDTDAWRPGVTMLRFDKAVFLEPANTAR